MNREISSLMSPAQASDGPTNYPSDTDESRPSHHRLPHDELTMCDTVQMRQEMQLTTIPHQFSGPISGCSSHRQKVQHVSHSATLIYSAATSTACSRQHQSSANTDTGALQQHHPPPNCLQEIQSVDARPRDTTECARETQCTSSPSPGSSSTHVSLRDTTSPMVVTLWSPLTQTKVSTPSSIHRSAAQPPLRQRLPQRTHACHHRNLSGTVHAEGALVAVMERVERARQNERARPGGVHKHAPVLTRPRELHTSHSPIQESLHWVPEVRYAPLDRVCRRHAGEEGSVLDVIRSHATVVCCDGEHCQAADGLLILAGAGVLLESDVVRGC